MRDALKAAFPAQVKRPPRKERRAFRRQLAKLQRAFPEDPWTRAEERMGSLVAGSRRPLGAATREEDDVV